MELLHFLLIDIGLMTVLMLDIVFNKKWLLCFACHILFIASEIWIFIMFGDLYFNVIGVLLIIQIIFLIAKFAKLKEERKE